MVLCLGFSDPFVDLLRCCLPRRSVLGAPVVLTGASTTVALFREFGAGFLCDIGTTYLPILAYGAGINSYDDPAATVHALSSEATRELNDLVEFVCYVFASRVYQHLYSNQLDKGYIVITLAWLVLLSFTN